MTILTEKHSEEVMRVLSEPNQNVDSPFFHKLVDKGYKTIDVPPIAIEKKEELLTVILPDDIQVNAFFESEVKTIKRRMVPAPLAQVDWYNIAAEF